MNWHLFLQILATVFGVVSAQWAYRGMMARLPKKETANTVNAVVWLVVILIAVWWTV
jgi:hypothetical protein